MPADPRHDPPSKVRNESDDEDLRCGTSGRTGVEGSHGSPLEGGAGPGEGDARACVDGIRSCEEGEIPCGAIDGPQECMQADPSSRRHRGSHVNRVVIWGAP